MRKPSPPPQWLPKEERAWIARHQAALEEIVVALQREREWPDPVALERDLRSHGTKIGLLAAANSIPPLLGRRESDPQHVVLTLFGLACVPAAAPILKSYVATLRLALARFDKPKTTAILTRADIQDHLRLDDAAMDVLSRVILLPGNPFLAGGQHPVDSGEYAIDERIVNYERITTVDALISKLADQRVAQSAPAALTQRPMKPAARESEGSPAITAGVWVLGIGANAYALVTAPLPVAVGVLSASLTAVPLHRRLQGTSPSYVATVAVVGLFSRCTHMGPQKYRDTPRAK